MSLCDFMVSQHREGGFAVWFNGGFVGKNNTRTYAEGRLQYLIDEWCAEYDDGSAPIWAALRALSGDF